MSEKAFKQIDSELTELFLQQSATTLNKRFARLTVKDIANIITEQPIALALKLFRHQPTLRADALLSYFSNTFIEQLLTHLEPSESVILLRRQPQAKQQQLLSILPKAVAQELSELLTYPLDTAGSLIDTQVIAFTPQITVAEAIKALKQKKLSALRHLFLVDDKGKLTAQLDIQALALANRHDTLHTFAYPIKTYAEAFEPKEEVVKKIEQFAVDAIPVIDINGRFIGLIRSRAVIAAVKEEALTDLQTMVGANKDEHALSSPYLALKMRLPWLEINLLTAFLAAAVVGLFESTLAKYTMLAILLPVAAGQSGNAGAQALAVTMRGLTLREITTRHWPIVLLKECATGFLNGLAIAITCFIGIYLWSSSIGLAFVTALAMIISMTIACMAGALVPIGLKWFGLDPAQSSSIFLTTVTDIAGFFSFLGIATLLAHWL